MLNFLNNCKNTGSAPEKVLQYLLENSSPYAGDITKPQQFHKIVKLGQTLAIPNSFLQRFTPRGERYDSIFEILTVHAAPRQKTTIFDSQRFSALTMSMMVGTIGRFSWMTSHTMRDMGRSTDTMALAMSKDVLSFFAPTSTFLMSARWMTMTRWTSFSPPS